MWRLRAVLAVLVAVLARALLLEVVAVFVPWLALGALLLWRLRLFAKVAVLVASLAWALVAVVEALFVGLLARTARLAATALVAVRIAPVALAMLLERVAALVVRRARLAVLAVSVTLLVELWAHVAVWLVVFTLVSSLEILAPFTLLARTAELLVLVSVRVVVRRLVLWTPRTLASALGIVIVTVSLVIIVLVVMMSTILVVVLLWRLWVASGAAARSGARVLSATLTTALAGTKASLSTSNKEEEHSGTKYTHEK